MQHELFGVWNPIASPDYLAVSLPWLLLTTALMITYRHNDIFEAAAASDALLSI